MPENIFDQQDSLTTSITGLTCKPLAILSGTISPEEMSRARGGDGSASEKDGDKESDTLIDLLAYPLEEPPGQLCEDPSCIDCCCDDTQPCPPDGPSFGAGLDEEDSSLLDEITETAEEIWDEATEFVEDVWDWLTDEEEEEEEIEDETEEDTEVYDP